MEAIHTTAAPAAIGPYSQAILNKGMLYASGQIALDPLTAKLVGEDAPEQATQIMKNIGAVLAAAKLDYSDIVKCTIFLQDMNDFKAVNAVYSTYFKPPYPARETVAVRGLPAGSLVEISFIAASKEA